MCCYDKILVNEAAYVIRGYVCLCGAQYNVFYNFNNA
jgi:hypothetical protein